MKANNLYKYNKKITKLINDSNIKENNQLISI